MAFPTTLDDLDATRGTSGQKLSTPNHITHHTLEDAVIEALQAKVGVDGSAVTASHDYKLGEVTSSDKAVGKTATQTLTNKTLTSPVVNSPTLTNSGNTLTLPTTTDTLVGRATTDTLTNKTLTTPTIGSFANATHDHSNAAGGGTLSATTALGSGTVPTARLGSGSATSATFLRGDQTWAAVAVARSSGVGSGNIATDETVTIAHGLSGTPTYVRFVFLLTSTNANFSYTQIIYSGGGQTAVYMTTEGGTSTSSSQDVSARLVATVGGGLTFTTITVQAPDATNIAFAKVKTNSPTGTYNYQWEAFI